MRPLYAAIAQVSPHSCSLLLLLPVQATRIVHSARAIRSAIKFVGTACHEVRAGVTAGGDGARGHLVCGRTSHHRGGGLQGAPGAAPL